jgi:hypothetical protein
MRKKQIFSEILSKVDLGIHGNKKKLKTREE